MHLIFSMNASTEACPKRGSSPSSSSEFEFWAVGNTPPQLLPADELFADGVLLPLHHLSFRQPPSELETRQGNKPEPEPAPDHSTLPAAASISCPPTSGSKRWKDIFRVGGKKPAEEKERRKERKGGGGGAAELNINIWPFARSRSSGNTATGGGRPRAWISGRKVSSAPCSRSNSRGESSKAAAGGTVGRRWAASPGRSRGVHVGRSSPVWQILRPEQRDKVTDAGTKATGGARKRVLSLNEDACAGRARGEGSCRGDDKVGLTGRARTGSEGGGSLFNLWALFYKRVY